MNQMVLSVVRSLWKCLFFLLATSITGVVSDILDFEEWLVWHGKSYSSVKEQEFRKNIWQHNQEKIVAVHNEAYELGWTSYAMTMSSPFADMTSEEFEAAYLMQPRHCALASSTTSPSTTTTQEKEKNKNKLKPSWDKTGFPTTRRIDWRTRGVLTPIKNQGHCGSCWTFSTTGVLEAHSCLASGRDCSGWTGLSEQQLVDCSGGFDNAGCSGGWPSAALEYIRYRGGIDLETSYEYRGQDQNCSAGSHEEASGVEVAEVFNITYQDEEDLEFALAELGPVSVAYQVSSDFRFYSHGIYDSYNATANETVCHGEEQWLNHAVVAIGMDLTEEGVPFYIVRNSWGTSWGMEGHFWMKRGVNLCGVSDCATFPIVPAAKKKPQQTEETPSHLRSGVGTKTESRG